MQIECLSDFANELGAWRAGEIVNVSPETADYLARCSPGSWRAAAPPAPPLPPAVAERLGAISTETATGLTAPDRIARGGRVRQGRG